MERFAAIPGKADSSLRFKCFLLVLAGFCLIQTLVGYVQSCSVPVFRYALERWRPDPYKGIYIYRNEIGEQDQALLKQLKDASSNAESPLNLIIREVNADSFPKEKLTALLQGPVPESLPVLLIWYPDQMGKSPPIWSEKLTPSLVKGLVQSPKRKDMAESLINGESVVWVFMPSGNATKDEDAKALIRRELDKAIQTYSDAPFIILSGGKQRKLSYGFPILTLSPEDPSERYFVETLLKSESDLYEYTDEPMVFPVFGRGRVLGCLFGEYITEKNIREATAFMSGACSCEVKALNPGVDLLVAAPWDMVVMNSFVEDTPLPELTGVMPEPPVPVEQATAVVTEQVPIKKSNNVLKSYGIALGSVLVIVVFAGIILTFWKKKD
jgi:hypothetical protein